MTHELKTCSCCGVSKPKTPDFFNRKKDYFVPLCKECRSAKRKAEYASNPEIKARQKIRMERWMRDNAERKRLSDLRYCSENRENARHRARKWYRDNIGRAKEYAREYAANNTEKVRHNKRVRKARIRGAGGTHTKEQTDAIRAAQKDKCAYCRESLKGRGQLDHIFPVAKGGSNNASNLQWLCEPCNNSKRAKDPVDYAQSLGLLI